MEAKVRAKLEADKALEKIQALRNQRDTAVIARDEVKAKNSMLKDEVSKLKEEPTKLQKELAKLKEELELFRSGKTRN